ncbi:MAG: hypothetical protein HOB70_06290 [Chloroflexi bacterium]|nr:hypothetical protein [Chloroflexota bacterium]
MGLLTILENLMIFILRKDKNATKRYIENHPELKGKRKEINKRMRKTAKALRDADYQL